MTEHKQRYFDRIILLNRLVSRNVTHAKDEKPPLHSGAHLFEILEKRFKSGNCIEFFNVNGDSLDDGDRKKINADRNLISISAFSRDQHEGREYVSMLVSYVDQNIKSFPVEDVSSFSGRDLSGSTTERGSFAAHVVVRLPSSETEYDDGSYRCAIEAIQNLSRANIEFLLSRQLRRVAESEGWTFDVVREEKGRTRNKSYKYHPRLELFADVGRSMFGEDGGKELNYLEFTHRHEKQNIAGKTSLAHDDFVASVKLRVSAKEGPADPQEKRGWFQALKNHYEMKGYKTKLYFRHNNGNTVGGAVSPSVAGATDLLMCPRETIKTTTVTGLWLSTIQPEIRDRMRELLDRDDLWKRAK
ncbi:hypothetical protein [Brucella sp. 22210]|uniref:hypothetical protein n=1 Tax=Brucella sp. 22210 TaxID=3453892 RepID=UPI003F85ECB2